MYVVRLRVKNAKPRDGRRMSYVHAYRRWSSLILADPRWSSMILDDFRPSVSVHCRGNVANCSCTVHGMLLTFKQLLFIGGTDNIRACQFFNEEMAQATLRRTVHCDPEGTNVPYIRRSLIRNDPLGSIQDRSRSNDERKRFTSRNVCPFVEHMWAAASRTVSSFLSILFFLFLLFFPNSLSFFI